MNKPNKPCFLGDVSSFVTGQTRQHGTGQSATYRRADSEVSRPLAGISEEEMMQRYAIMSYKSFRPSKTWSSARSF